MRHVFPSVEAYAAVKKFGAVELGQLTLRQVAEYVGGGRTEGTARLRQDRRREAVARTGGPCDGSAMLSYSPALSIVTATLELAGAAWALRAPGRRAVLMPVALMFVFLAGYQLVEVFVCADPTNVLLARMAFMDVVWLPPLGLLLVLRLGQPRRRIWTWLVRGSIGLAGVITVWVAIDPVFVTGTVCQAVVAFYIHPSSGIEFYGMFYHTGLWAMMVGGIRVILKGADARDRAHAADFVIGTVGFVVLALTTEVVFPGTRNGTPSVMCHYAIVLAVFLGRLVWREQRTTRLAASGLGAAAGQDLHERTGA